MPWLIFIVLLSVASTGLSINRPVYKIVLKQKGYAQVCTEHTLVMLTLVKTAMCHCYTKIKDYSIESHISRTTKFKFLRAEFARMQAFLRIPLKLLRSKIN